MHVYSITITNSSFCIAYKTWTHSCVCLCFTYRITGHWFHFQHTMCKLILKHYSTVHQFNCPHSLAHNQDRSNFLLLQFCHFSHHTEQGGSRRWTSCGPAPNVVQDRLHRGTGELQCVSKSQRQLCHRLHYSIISLRSIETCMINITTMLNDIV